MTGGDFASSVAFDAVTARISVMELRPQRHTSEGGEMRRLLALCAIGTWGLLGSAVLAQDEPPGEGESVAADKPSAPPGMSFRQGR